MAGLYEGAKEASTTKRLENLSRRGGIVSRYCVMVGFGDIFGNLVGGIRLFARGGAAGCRSSKPHPQIVRPANSTRKAQKAALFAPPCWTFGGVQNQAQATRR